MSIFKRHDKQEQSAPITKPTDPHTKPIVVWEKPLPPKPSESDPTGKRFAVEMAMVTSVDMSVPDGSENPAWWTARAWFHELGEAIAYAEGLGGKYVRIVDLHGTRVEALGNG